MDAAQWPKDVTSNGSYNKKQVEVEEKKVKPAHEEGMIKCPRCNSSNTKFCYYNNYSLTQPRYFCKACKRYWTKGGSLRSVPVGGGSRKNNKNRSISSSSTPKPIDLSHLSSSSQNFTTQQQQDYHHHLGFSQFLMPPKFENGNNAANLSSSSSSDHGLNSFSTRATTTSWDLMLNGTRFGLQEEAKPTLGMGMGMGMEFPFQGIGNGIKYGSFQEGDIGEISERNMLPFGVSNHQHYSSSLRSESGQISIMGQAAAGNSTTGYTWNDQSSGGAGFLNIV